MSMQDDAERVEINDRNERERRGLPPKHSGGHTPGNMQAEWTRDIMRPDQVAETMCKALAFAARQASSPIFEDFRANPGHSDFTLRVALSGGKRYVVRIEEDEEVTSAPVLPPAKGVTRHFAGNEHGYIDMPSSDD